MELVVETGQCARPRLLDLVNQALLEQPHAALVVVIHRRLPDSRMPNNGKPL
jgi:hypothetical protein